jgi:peptidoglycan LD-endopeptidase LytH
MNKSEEVIRVLKNSEKKIAPVLGFNLNRVNVFAFDLSKDNHELKQINLNNTDQFTDYVFNTMQEKNTPVAVGKYNENRTIYARSELFKGEENPRTIHLGIDLWAKAETPVYAPLPGKVHSFQNNDQFGDFGPTIILEHNIEPVIFYTLYGHLSLDSLTNLKIGSKIAAGSQIAKIGNYPVNGNWPPHLHFQIITDLLGMHGDFYGVVSIKDHGNFLKICPDPNHILRIDYLNSI